MVNELHRAASDAEHGFSLVKRLIEIEHVDVNRLDDETKCSAVIYAADSGSLETLQYLIDVAKVSLDANQSRINILDSVIHNQNQSIRQYIGNLPPEKIKEFNDGTIELHAAAFSGDIERVTRLLAQDPNAIHQENANQRTPLFYAASQNHESIIQCILTHPAFLSKSEGGMDDLNRGRVSFFINQREWHGEELSTDKEIEFFESSIHSGVNIMFKDSDDYACLVSNYNGLGCAYYAEQKIDSARDSFESALKIIEEAEAEAEGDDEHLLELKRAVLTNQSLMNNQNKFRDFNVVDVPSDGNCFFHVIAHQLALNNVNDLCGLSYHHLRSRAAEHIETHWDLYSPFILEEDREHYLANIKQDGVWADHTVIQALSRELNVTLVIFKDFISKPTILKRADAVATIYLNHWADSHYLSLTRRSDLSVYQDLDELIRDHDVDGFTVDSKRKISSVVGVNSFFNSGETAVAESKVQRVCNYL